jgi:ADP-heptose:LPS heptosyltransferase
MLKLVKKKAKKPVSLRDHQERRNKILIKRRSGGYGDILMQRMLFEDFSKAFPDAEITFACPALYIEMAKNHPFAKAIDLGSVNEEEYGAVYDLSTACRVHESRFGERNKDHRSDIWAAHCGIVLKNHNMMLKPDPIVLEQCREAFKRYNKEGKPAILLASTSTPDMVGTAKSLTYDQISDVVKSLRDQGFYVFTIHTDKQVVYDNLGVDQIFSIHQQAWISMVELADAVISVDTGTFHIAGGLGKPLIGIFTFTDGKLYGKYYDFVLVQKHRDNGDWDCGPCFNMTSCPKSKETQKPCLTELSSYDILQGFAEAVEKWPSLKNSLRNKRTDLLGRTS